MRCRARVTLLAGSVAILCGTLTSVPISAHHSFAMYDSSKTYTLTGVVTRVSPDSNHLLIFFAPLDEARKAVIRDEQGQPAIWTVELRGAAQVAQEGVTVESFPPGTIFSIGLHPLRNGLRGGGRAEYGLFRCPDATPPPRGRHCDSVQGSTAHGRGVLPEPTHAWP